MNLKTAALLDEPAGSVIATRMLLSGDEAVALAAKDAHVALGTGYPGTPSTEILERFGELGGRAQWAPNEKVALEVGVGVAFAGADALVTMKHVGLNVAADVLFTVAYSGVPGGLVIACADDPGMSSSQNEQDNRRYAVAAGVPMLEPSDSQEAYDFTIAAFELSREWNLPVLLRLTTRVCHSKTILTRRRPPAPPPPARFVRNIPERVMIPAHARPAHRRLREKLANIAGENESSPLNRIEPGDHGLGIIVSGVAYAHAKEAAPDASFLKLGTTYPLPMRLIRAFASTVARCVVIEEGDPYLVDALRADGCTVEGKPEMYRFGELNVSRVARILAGDTSPEPAPPRGKPPALCPACPYRPVFETLKSIDCIVAGDIGCYTLGALPPLSAMDTQLCMGASIGVGLGLRHALPDVEARRVVSVIGDSTFMHSGLTGLAEMVYNPPPTGHVLIVLDNGTTAMTGQQEHPGTGRKLNHDPSNQLSIGAVARGMGLRHVYLCDPVGNREAFATLLRERLAANDLTLIIAKKPCILAAGKIRAYEQRDAALRAKQEVEGCSAACGCTCGAEGAAVEPSKEQPQ